ncbi:MAG: YdeI/OmpD-associated family protein [Xanthobacteraceae bacterium]
MKREEPEPKVPADLRKVLSAASQTRAQWNDLTPLARQDFIMWIDSAKQRETRKRRLESVPSKLASGKRRPCCFAIVPLDLHKALAGIVKAKSEWSKLTSLERRDFAGWVGSAKDSQMRRERAAKTCLMLAAGKRRL